MTGTGDLYERLGVAPGADGAEIRRRYLELAARYHPDRHQGNPLGDLAGERLAQLNAAYEVLSDPALRAAYDARHAGASRGGRGSPDRAPASASAGVRQARAIIRLLGLAAGLVLALRLVPGLVRFVVGALAGERGRVLIGALLAALVVGAIVVGVRARRSSKR